MTPRGPKGRRGGSRNSKLRPTGAKMGADLVATENHVAVTHQVNPAADAVLPQHWKDWMASNTPCKVNSYHNFAVRMHHGGSFCPIMVSEDGCVEAMESAAGAPRMIGIMWHPERSLPKCGESDNLEYRNANKDLTRTIAVLKNATKA